MCPDPSGASAPHSFPLEARFSAAAPAPGRRVFLVLCHHLLPCDLLCPSPQPSPSCSHPSHSLSLNLHSDNSQISAPSLATFLHSGLTSSGQPVRSAPGASHGLFQLSPSQGGPFPVFSGLDYHNPLATCFPSSDSTSDPSSRHQSDSIA